LISVVIGAPFISPRPQQDIKQKRGHGVQQACGEHPKPIAAGQGASCKEELPGNLNRQPENFKDEIPHGGHYLLSPGDRRVASVRRTKAGAEGTHQRQDAQRRMEQHAQQYEKGTPQNAPAPVHFELTT
jgi:hypothetical protein